MVANWSRYLELGCVRVWVDLDYGAPPCSGVAQQSVGPANSYCGVYNHYATLVYTYISSQLDLNLQMMLQM